MTVLDDIIAHKRVEVAAHRAATPLDAVRARAEAAPPARSFAGAIAGRALYEGKLDFKEALKAAKGA